jgi:hypothetical protein
LVLRNAGKLIVYWDIFRDYVLYKQVPAIPTRYIPVSTPASAKNVLDVLSPTTNTQLGVLGKRLGRQQGTLDNIARDLVMMGVCQYDRKNFKLKLVHASQRQSLGAMFKFFNTHALLRALVENFGPGFKSVPLSSIESVLRPSFDDDAYTEMTIHSSVIRWLSWQQALGVLSVDSQRAVSHNINAFALAGFDDLRIEQRARSGSFIFKGEAPPGKVLALLNLIVGGNYDPSPEDRNSLTVLRSLRLIPSTAQPVLLESPPVSKRDLWLALKVIGQPSLIAALELVVAKPDAGAVEVGEVLEKFTPNTLSDASKRRYGTGLTQWIAWARVVLKSVQTPKLD